MPDFSEQARRAARRAEAARRKKARPVKVPFDPLEFKQCKQCPFTTRARCRASNVGCV